MLKLKPAAWVKLERNRSSVFNRSIVFVGLFLSLLMALATLYRPEVLQRVKAAVYDRQLSYLEAGKPSDIPLIVDIDEDSLAEYGQWPWPRYRVALLLAKLRAWGASVVALDMVFPEKDRTSPLVLKDTIERDLQVSLSLDGIPEALRDNDRILAEVLSSGPFVLGTFFSFQDSIPGASCSPGATNIALISRGSRGGYTSKLFESKSAICNIPVLSNAAQTSGFFNARPDVDGIYRKGSLLISHGGKVYPSLALEATLRSLGVSQLMVEQSPNGYSLRLPGREILLDDFARLQLRFRGGGRTFPYVSAKSILNDTVDPETFREKVVFIGSSSTGLNDIRSTPLDPVMPGVELQAVVADNLLTGSYLRYPDSAVALEAAGALVAGVLLSFIIVGASPYLGVSAFVASLFAVGASSQALLSGQGLIVSPVPCVITLVLVFGFLFMLKYWNEQLLHKKRIEQYQAIQEATIEGFGSLAEYRDPETGGHIRRTQAYVRLLAEKLKGHERFRSFLNDISIDILVKVAPLHDVGKVGVSDSILTKPGRLTDEEFDDMKLHTVYGGQVFKAIEERVGQTPFSKTAYDIANSHQEKWDGSGYPEGLSGEEIPIGARLMALADVYDALISERVYKPAFSHQKAKSIIVEGRGAHFDPDVVDAFLAVERRFVEVALKYSDSQSQRDALLAEEVAEAS